MGRKGIHSVYTLNTLQKRLRARNSGVVFKHIMQISLGVYIIITVLEEKYNGFYVLRRLTHPRTNS
jgi:hypothetical protein